MDTIQAVQMLDNLDYISALIVVLIFAITLKGGGGL